MLELVANNIDVSKDYLALISFAVTSSFLLCRTLCNLYNEIVAGRDAADNKKMRHFKP